MNLPAFRRLALAAIFALASAGCESTATRIQKNPDVLAAAPPATQERIRRGEIAIGDTPELVQLAKGRPLRTANLPDGSIEWIYRDHPRNENDYIAAGFRHRVEFDPVTRGNTVIVEPVDPRLYPSLRTHTIHVILRDGHVMAIRVVED